MAASVSADFCDFLETFYLDFKKKSILNHENNTIELIALNCQNNDYINSYLNKLLKRITEIKNMKSITIVDLLLWDKSDKEVSQNIRTFPTPYSLCIPIQSDCVFYNDEFTNKCSRGNVFFYEDNMTFYCKQKKQLFLTINFF